MELHNLKKLVYPKNCFTKSWEQFVYKLITLKTVFKINFQKKKNLEIWNTETAKNLMVRNLALTY